MSPDSAPDDTPDRAAAARRRRRLAALGDTSAEHSADDQDVGWSDSEPGGTRDDHLLREVPPHHG